MLIFVFLIILLLLFALGGSGYFAYTAMKPNCAPLEEQIQRSLVSNGFDPALAAIPYEDWELASSSSSLLKARFYANGGEKRIVLLLHGYNSPWISMLKYYELLTEQGFAILVPDHQAQGRSPGKWISYGAIESEDAILWLRELQRRCPGAELSVMGESLGGATSLLVAEKCCQRDIPIRFCVADCPYNDCSDELEFVGRRRYGFVVKLLMPLVGLWFRLFSGHSIREASPLRQIESLAVPTLLVHGSADRTVPVAMSRRLAELCPYITYWEAEDAPHAAVIAVYPEEYRRRLERFCGEVRV